MAVDLSTLPDIAERKVGEHLRPPRFGEIQVGEEFAPVRYVADDAAIKAYCYAVDCYDPWYFQAVAPYPFRLAPSCMVLKELMWLYQTVYDRSRVRGLHQHEETKFLRPVPAGIELIFTGRVVDKYERRGKGYFIHESEARDAEGRLYVSQRNNEIIEMSMEPVPGSKPATATARKRVTGNWHNEQKPVEALASTTAVGAQLPERIMRADRAQMAVFSGVADNFENLHTRLPIAVEMGFPDVVVQGLTTVCWLCEHLLRWAGPTWLSSGVLNATFLKPMLANQPLRLRAVVSGQGEENGRKSVELEAWTLDEQEDKTAVATVAMAME